MGGGGRVTAAELHGVATRVYDLWAADFAAEPRALALRRWAESTVFAWARELRGVGHAGLLYAEQSRADALARHLAHLAATGKSSAALCGTISAVRMAKKLQLLRPTVCPIHRAIAAGAGLAYNSEPRQQVWGTLGMLRTMATAVRSETDFAVLALAVFSACHGLRVGEAASIRRTDVSQPGWSSSTIARPRGGGSRPSWEPERSGGDRPCWHVGSYNAGLSTCHSYRRRNSNAACTSCCGVPHGWESPGTFGDGSQRQQQPWSRLVPQSPLCASGTDGPRNGRHGNTPFQGQTGNLSSQIRPLGRTRPQVSPHCPCPRSSSGPRAPSGGAQPPMLRAPLLSSWSTVMTKGTTPTMGYWEPLARIVEWPQEDGNDVRALRAADKTRHRPRVRVRIRLRRPKARRSHNNVSSADHSRHETVQPASASPQPTAPPLPRQGQSWGSWSPPQSACQKCGKPISEHILDAAVSTAIKASVDHHRADILLRMWWAESHRWALDWPKVSTDDEALLHDMLHHLAMHGPPDKASSPQLGDGDAVTIELAGRGLGLAGSVQVPDNLWAQWADPHFRQAGETAPTAQESSCPKVAALLHRLHADGLIHKSHLSPNARAFIKYKSLAKCALIIDMQAFNHACSFKARLFRPPSLEGLAGLLRPVRGGGGGVGGQD